MGVPHKGVLRRPAGAVGFILRLAAPALACWAKFSGSPPGFGCADIWVSDLARTGKWRTAKNGLPVWMEEFFAAPLGL